MPRKKNECEEKEIHNSYANNLFNANSFYVSVLLLKFFSIQTGGINEYQKFNMDRLHSIWKKLELNSFHH